MTSPHEYADWLRSRGYARETIVLRSRVARKLHGMYDTLAVDRAQLVAFLSPHSGWTRHTYLASLHSLAEYLAEQGIALDVDSIIRPPLPRTQTMPLSPEQQETLLAAADAEGYAFAALALYAGLRRAEIASFSGRDIDGQRVKVCGKGGEVDYLPVHPILADLALTMPAGAWFPGVSAARVGRVITALLREQGLNGGPHRLRATFATNLRKAGWDVAVIQRLMRHRLLASTQHYLVIADDELGAAIRSLAA